MKTKKKKAPPGGKTLLSAREIELVVLACVAGAPGGTVVRKEIERAVEWARDIRVNMGLLQAVLDRDLVVDTTSAEIRFKLSEKRKKRAARPMEARSGKY